MKNDKKTFYLTFCRKHQLRNNFVTVRASSYDNACSTVIAKFRMDWQQIWKEDDFDKSKFPKGEAFQIEGA